MPKLVRATPAYRLHRPSGQAVVTLDGRDLYLGPWRSKASRLEYDRLIGEWLAGGRHLPRSGAGPGDLSVHELLDRYWTHAAAYYVDRDGRPTSEVDCLRVSLGPVRTLYARTAARAFGPLALKAVREQFVKAGICRSQVNARVDRIKRMFRWAVAEELVDASVLHALAAVEGLRYGRSEAPERPPVQPVPDALVDAVLPFLPPPVAAMVELQRLTGMRPGEVVAMRRVDLDTAGEVWLYLPRAHKNSWREHGRVVAIGPRAQAILRPWFKFDAEAYLFSPAAAEERRNVERRENRRSPMTPSQRRRLKARTRRRPPGSLYTVAAYRRAITRACKLADREAHKRQPEVPAAQVLVPPWTPHQLRHRSATEIRRQFGLEAAQAVLGHQHADVTQLYAARHLGLAIQVAKEVG